MNGMIIIIIIIYVEKGSKIYRVLVIPTKKTVSQPGKHISFIKTDSIQVKMFKISHSLLRI